MAVDVRTQMEIARPRDEVAAFAADPDNAPRWYANIKQVTWKSPRPTRGANDLRRLKELLESR